MRNTLRTLVLGGSLLAAAAMANAQTTTLLDSIGNLTALGSGDQVGIDPQSSVSGTATVPSQAGLAVLPFTLSAGTYNNLSVSVLAAVQTPSNAAQTTSNNLWGVFIQAPTGNSINANSANIVGGFFQFDLKTNGLVNAAGLGTGADGLALANNTGITLTGGSYWLVFAPKNSFGSSASDLNANGTTNLLDLGRILRAQSGQITTAGGSLNGAFATETQAQFEVVANAAADPGDVLRPAQSVVGTRTTTLFYAARLTTSSVPETSTVVTAFLGLAPIGGLLLRRRRAK